MRYRYAEFKYEYVYLFMPSIHVIVLIRRAMKGLRSISEKVHTIHFSCLS